MLQPTNCVDNIPSDTTVITANCPPSIHLGKKHQRLIYDLKLGITVHIQTARGAIWISDIVRNSSVSLLRLQSKRYLFIHYTGKCIAAYDSKQQNRWKYAFVINFHHYTYHKSIYADRKCSILVTNTCTLSHPLTIHLSNFLHTC